MLSRGLIPHSGSQILIRTDRLLSLIAKNGIWPCKKKKSRENASASGVISTTAQKIGRIVRGSAVARSENLLLNHRLKTVISASGPSGPSGPLQAPIVRLVSSLSCPIVLVAARVHLSSRRPDHSAFLSSTPSSSIPSSRHSSDDEDDDGERGRVREGKTSFIRRYERQADRDAGGRQERMMHDTCRQAGT